MSWSKSWFGLVGLGALLSLASPAAGQVIEPNGLEVPLPVSGDLNDCPGLEPLCNANTVSLPALFDYYGEDIDYVADASTVPAVFSPLCSFSGTLVLRGGGCKVAFGWYNAVASGGDPPPPDQIYTLIPADDPDVYECNDSGAFCPLAVDGPWTLKTFTANDIRSDARYQGGLIGFAMIGGGGCSQTHFSQQELNQECTNCTADPNNWVTAITYQSTATPDAFYLAFEDLPFSPTGLGGNDGDFNDFVFFISGLVCAGGGEPCDTGMPGACSVGRTDCGTDGTASLCRPVIHPTDEACDNVDNDCNEIVDDGDLCDPGFVCDRGSCVAECNTGEFRCPEGLECENGFCIDPLCVGVECMPGQACRAGQCVDPCTGVTCPLNQECQLGRCVDLCAAVMCEEGTVCERGVCLATCDCRPCADGKVCGNEGKCVDPGCETQTCQPGQVCVAGTCTDACAQAVCPGGAACTMGNCGAPMVDMGSGAVGGSGGGSGGSIVINTGNTTSMGGNSSAGTGMVVPEGQPVAKRNSQQAGCACRLGAGDRQGPAKLLALLGLGLLFGARRRRSS